MFDRLDCQLARLRRELETAARFRDEGAAIIAELAAMRGTGHSVHGRVGPIPVGPLYGKAIWQRTFEAASCGHTTSDRSTSQSL
jgi:hypothetical protein